MSRFLYMAAASFLLLNATEVYSQNAPNCQIRPDQFSQAKELMERQVRIGEEMRQKNITGKSELIKHPSIAQSICSLAQEIDAHQMKYRVNGQIHPTNPNYCSTFYGQMEALSSMVPITKVIPLGPIEQMVKIIDSQKRLDALSVGAAMKDYCNGSSI